MKEIDAVGKWCPFVQVSNNSTANPIIDNRNQKCIASGCMVWRLHPKHEDEEPGGYCGLAGKP